MSLYTFFTTLSVGGWLSIFIVACTLIEITPIKINPVQWLGNRLNQGMMGKVDKIEKKVDEHIAQSYRNKIMYFQDDLLNHGCSAFTQEQYDEVLEAIENYEKYCKDNNITNHKCEMATDYIKRCYEKCQNNRSFANLPDQPKETA